MWKPKNLLEALLPIFIINVIFCHGVIQYPNVSKSKIFHSFLYSVITKIGHIICLVYVYLKYFCIGWISDFQLIYFIGTIIMNISMNINIIVGWFYKTKILMINSRIIKADKMLDNLGVPVNSQKEFCFSKKIVFIWLAHLLYLNSVKIIWWREPIGLQFITFSVFILQHAYHVNFLIDLMFFLTIKHMKIRFKSVNELLSDIFKLQTNVIPLNVSDRNWAISRKMEFNENFPDILQNIRSIHFELGLLCGEITKIFEVPIVLTMISSFIMFLGLLMRLYLSIFDSRVSGYSKTAFLIVVFIWLLIYTIKFFAINYICEGTVNEWQETGEIVHKIEIKSKNTELRNELQQFSIQLIKNPLKFTPCGLFDLNYYFVRDLVGSVTAYLVLLIQTYSSNK